MVRIPGFHCPGPIPGQITEILQAALQGKQTNKQTKKKCRISAPGPQNLHFPRSPRRFSGTEAGPKPPFQQQLSAHSVDTLTLICANPLLLNTEVVSKL